MVIGDKMLMRFGNGQERKKYMCGIFWYSWGVVEICLQIVIES